MTNGTRSISNSLSIHGKGDLRDHTGNVCWHGDFETRGSQVSALSQGNHAHWFIEGPFPCLEKYQLKVL